MELLIVRKPSSDKATLGMLDVDGLPFCFTLEDVVRDLGPDGAGKVYGQTAIQEWRYQVDITWSAKFQKKMLAVLNVPFFTGIRIHSGNDDADTLGCILVGSMIDGPDHIHGGSEVLPRLFAQVQAALDKGEQVWLTIQAAA